VSESFSIFDSAGCVNAIHVCGGDGTLRGQIDRGLFRV
jgi:hypothetical protein